tara:strand:- start:252 stop:509 length:258 start_codon:yes stop_codon:yes gene_type:complete
MSEVVYFNSDGKVALTDNDAVKQKNMEDLRAMRNQMLMGTDWTQSPDSPLTDSQKTSWATYRQSLRDITDSATSLDNVTWPTKPS